MLPIGMGLAFIGYSIGSWGWILTKGWNITLRQWMSPLNPYQWPAGGAAPPVVPQGQIFPGPAATSGSSGSSQPPPGNSIYNVPGIGPLLHGINSLL